MELEIYKEANNIWKKAASPSVPEQLNFELTIYKKLLNFFQVGDYFYSIFNYTTNEFDYVSPDVKLVFGYDIKDYNIPYLLGQIHPDDKPCFLNFENRAMDFLTSLTVDQLMKYKIRHDYRVKKADGTYVRVLQQGIVLEHDEHGGILRTLIVHTDISDFKTSGKPVLSFIGLEGEPSYIDVDVKEVFAVSEELISKREKEVLMLLIDGKLSKEIGEILHISKQTVDKHRQNMIARNGLKNTSELIAKAIRQGWV